MVLQLRPQAVHRGSGDVIDAQHGMGVAHGNRCQFDGLAVHFYRVAQGFGVGDEGNLLRDQARRAHVHGHLPVRTDIQFDDAALGFHADALFHRQALVDDEAGEAARAVAALLHFRTIGVEDAVAEVDVRVGRRFDDQQLVETDARVAVAPLLGVLGLDMGVLADQVEDHEVVAEAVHLGEAQ
ncbi:hypothetical protein D9M73_209340 [compost metagenome]